MRTRRRMLVVVVYAATLSVHLAASGIGVAQVRRPYATTSTPDPASTSDYDDQGTAAHSRSSNSRTYTNRGDRAETGTRRADRAARYAAAHRTLASESVPPEEIGAPEPELSSTLQTIPCDETSGPRLFGQSPPAGYVLTPAPRFVYGENENQTAITLLNSGFYFLRPFTNHSGNFDLRNIAPKSAAALNSLHAGNLFHDFSLAPSLTADVSTDTNNSGFTVSGMGISLQGTLERSLLSNGTTVSVKETGNITIVSSNIEGFINLWPNGARYASSNRTNGSSTVLTYGHAYEPACHKFTIGGKVLTTLSQTVTGTITDPTNGVTAFSATSTPSVMLGVTGSWQPYFKLHDAYGDTGALALYGIARGSLVVGNELRGSTIAITPTGGMSMPATTFSDNTTQWVPIGEFELGLRYGTAALYNDEKKTLKSFRAAAIFQVYGNVGLVSATSTNQFTNTNLYLVGGVVQAGF